MLVALQVIGIVMCSQSKTDYKFAKYNAQPTVYEWSQDEYSRHLEGTSLSFIESAHVLIIFQTANGQKKKQNISSNLHKNMIYDGISSMTVMNIRVAQSVK